MELKKLNGQADDKQIGQWKKDHIAGIFFISNDTDIAYFRKPMRQDVNKAQALASEEAPFAAIEEFGRLTYIGGSEKILKDDQMFLGAKGELAKYWSGIKAISGNL